MAESSHALVLPLRDRQAIPRSEFPSRSPLQSNARAYASVAQCERHVFVGEVSVTTFHTYHRKTKRSVASLIECHSDVFILREICRALNDRECKTKFTRKMAKSSKLVAVKRGRILLVRRRRDRLWMFPGGQKRERESDKDCLRREIKEELPKLKLGQIRLWKKVNGTNRHSGRAMSDAISRARYPVI
jgi:hypothetical protein